MRYASRILVTGASGLVGSALVRRLQLNGHPNVSQAFSRDYDLRDPGECELLFRNLLPEYVFHAAAKVGGIIGNDIASAEFIRDNLAIQSNVIEMSRVVGVRKLLFFGSSCAYPKHAPCPIQEDSLMTGQLEPTNRAYAVAKIAGIEMCNAYRKQYGCDFISCMPTNLYGIGDHYDLQNSHVIPGMIRRIHEAKIAGAPEVVLWGTGTPTREFLFSSDIAAAAICLMENYSGPRAINIGSGQEVTLAHVANQIAAVICYPGRIKWDHTKPDGTPRRCLDSSRILRLGWEPTISLEDGLRAAYEDFLWRKH